MIGPFTIAWVGSIEAGLIGPLELKKLLIFELVPLLGENICGFFWSSCGEVGFELELSLLSYDFILIPLPSPRDVVCIFPPPPMLPMLGKLFIY